MRARFLPLGLALVVMHPALASAQAPGGRSVVDSGDSNFGASAEAARLSRMKNDLDKERDRLSRYRTWLQEESRKLDARSNALDNQVARSSVRRPHTGARIVDAESMGASRSVTRRDRPWPWTRTSVPKPRNSRGRPPS